MHLNVINRQTQYLQSKKVPEADIKQYLETVSLNLKF